MHTTLACAIIYPVALKSFLATTFRTFLGVFAFGVLAASTVIHLTRAFYK